MLQGSWHMAPAIWNLRKFPLGLRPNIFLQPFGGLLLCGVLKAVMVSSLSLLRNPAELPYRVLFSLPWLQAQFSHSQLCSAYLQQWLISSQGFNIKVICTEWCAVLLSSLLCFLMSKLWMIVFSHWNFQKKLPLHSCFYSSDPTEAGWKQISNWKLGWFFM